MADRTPGKQPFMLALFLHARWPLLAKIYALSKRGFPFMLPSMNSSPMRRLRGHARCHAFAHHPLPLRWLERAVMTFTWPLGALIDTIYNLRMTPSNPAPNNFPAVLRRLGHMLALALFENVPSVEYQAYRLYDPKRSRMAGDYLYWNELNLLRLLNERNGADNEDVQDKGRFADICRRHGFPCIPPLAIYREGKQVFPDTPYVPDQPALWVKDLAGSQRRGAGQWVWRDGAYHSPEGKAASAEELAASWRKRNCIVQPLLRNHPDLESLSDGTLADMRIVTGIDPDGEVHLITHDITLPWGGFANRPKSALGKLDDSGRIIRTLYTDGRPAERHPETGAIFTDAVIPFWREARELVQQAHRKAFPRFVFLGWDVAITVEGPVLIETNSGPGFLHHQLLDDMPLGSTPFATIASRYFEKAEKCA